jgi:hypothetical protein
MDTYSQLKCQKLGYYRFNDPAAFKYFKWFYRMPMVKHQSAKYPILYYPFGKLILKATQQRLKHLYLNGLNISRGTVDAWRGVDVGTDQWHNDMPDGYNTAFLMYLCDTSPETGGGLEFRARDFSYTEIVFPKKYDIIVLDQDLRYEHRVLPLIKQINRDIANIEFNILEE